MENNEQKDPSPALFWKTLEIATLILSSAGVYFAILEYNPEMWKLVAFVLSLGIGYVLTIVIFFFIGVFLGLLSILGLVDRDILKKSITGEVDVKEQIANIEKNENEGGRVILSPVPKEHGIEDPFVYSENIIGRYMDKPIYEWIKFPMSDKKFVYHTVVTKNKDGVYPLSDAIPNFIILLEPGVIYVPE